MSELWRRKWQLFQYSCQKNLMDSGAWRATVPGVEKSRTRLSNWACLHVRTLFFSWFVILLASEIHWILKFRLSFYSFFEVVLYYCLLSVLPEALVNTLEKSLRDPWVVWKFTQIENLGPIPSHITHVVGLWPRQVTSLNTCFLIHQMTRGSMSPWAEYEFQVQVWAPNFESTIY